MKVKVIRLFRDKDNFAKVYKVGDIIDVDKDRAERMIFNKAVEKVGNSKKSE